MTIKGRDRELANHYMGVVDNLLEERENYFKMLNYAGIYEISIQFWGESNTNVFIAKDGIELTDFGGLDPAEAIAKTVEYLDRINGVKK